MAAHELDESPEHVIEATSQRGLHFRQVAKCRTNLEARKHLAQRTERGVVPRRPVSTARVAPLGDIERGTAESCVCIA